MPPGINAGKVEGLEDLCKKLGVGDGELALMKVDALAEIVALTIPTNSFERAKSLIILRIGEEYNPDTVEQLIDCMVHSMLSDRMAEVVKGIDNSLLK